MTKLISLIILILCLKVLNGQVDKKLIQQKIKEKSNTSEFDSIVKKFGYRTGDEIKVWAIFSINQEGKIVDIKTRGPHSYFEEEAERILQNTPEIVPENFKSREKNPRFSLPITFVIDSKKKKAKKKKKKKL